MEGNQTLTLYGNFLPNIENSVHLRFTDVNEYIYYINANYAIGAYLHVDNYRLNANTLKVSMKYFFDNNIDYKKVTYLHLEQVLGNIYAGGKVVHNFYYVKDAKVQSDYVIYTIEIDYWATYQFLLDNGKIQLNRTNAVLANETMVYDEIVKAETPFHIDPVNYSYRLSGTGDTRRYLANSNFYVVFIVEYVTVRNLANTDYVKATDLFAITLSALIASLEAGASYASVDLASMIISGITSTTTSIGGVNNDAKVIGAYIVPNFESEVSTHLSGTQVEFNYRTMLTGNTTKKFTANHMYTYRRDVPYYQYLTPTNNWGDGINYKYYVGSFHNYMQLVNYRKSNGVQFMVSFVFSPSKVQLIVSQGDNSKDITNAITIPQIANVEISDALQTMCYIADGLGMALNNAKGIMNSKSYGELALNVGDALLDNFKFFKGNVNADMGVTQGDGLTELRKDHDNCMHPLNIIYFKSLNDEAYNARLIGANVNATIENIDVIDGLNLLGNTPQDVTFDNYYVRGNLVTTAVGQKDAFDIIASKLRNGIHLKFIHDIS
ncbi:MAG: hypothetical protein J5598_03205 [Clostridia bacterium]|nr:hypothetical protein [Clostridia bacterium]